MIFDPEFNVNRALDGAHYCIYCHKQGKDSCSKGLEVDHKYDKLEYLPTQNTKSGCPLKHLQ